MASAASRGDRDVARGVRCTATARLRSADLRAATSGRWERLKTRKAQRLRGKTIAQLARAGANSATVSRLGPLARVNSRSLEQIRGRPAEACRPPARARSAASSGAAGRRRAPGARTSPRSPTSTRGRAEAQADDRGGHLRRRPERARRQRQHALDVGEQRRPGRPARRSRAIPGGATSRSATSFCSISVASLNSRPSSAASSSLNRIGDETL